MTPCRTLAQSGWLLLRQALWPHCTVDEHLAEMSAFLAQPARFAAFIEYDGIGGPAGLVEISVRTDYVNGASASPTAFLEGLYVVPQARHLGVARKLVFAAEHWAMSVGCTELASDAGLENTASHAVHRALGFVETERVVFFRKDLGRGRSAE